MRFGVGIDEDWSPQRTRRLRALFLSDVHLGTRACQGERLIDFLHHHDAETIYLVGDIIDGWRLRSTWYWPSSHEDILQVLLRAAWQGTRIVYLPGNHDAFLRDYYGRHFGGIEVAEQAVHVAADGRRYLVVHGDHFDRSLRHTRRFAFLGGTALRLTVGADRALDAVRAALGFSSPWAPSQWVKRRIKRATRYLDDYEQNLAEIARSHAVDGVICGHVHHAAIHDQLGVRYINCGDWLESCTAVAETADGHFELLRWIGKAPRGEPSLIINEPRTA